MSRWPRRTPDGRCNKKQPVRGAQQTLCGNQGVYVGQRSWCWCTDSCSWQNICNSLVYPGNSTGCKLLPFHQQTAGVETGSRKGTPGDSLGVGPCIHISTPPLTGCVTMSETPFPLVKMEMLPILQMSCWGLLEIVQTRRWAHSRCFNSRSWSYNVNPYGFCYLNCHQGHWKRGLSCLLPPALRILWEPFTKLPFTNPSDPQKPEAYHLPCLHLQIVFLWIWNKMPTLTYTIRTCYYIQMEGQTPPHPL